MLRTILTLSLSAILAVATAAAQPTAAGDVMLVAFDADGADGFAVITLVDLPSATRIHFSDNEWDGVSAFADTAEGEATWINDTGGTLAEGTVLVFTNMSSVPQASLGTITGETINLNASNEQLWAYLGTATLPSLFLSAIANDDFSSGGNSIANTGLVVGTSAIEIASSGSADEDVALYVGPTGCDGLTRLECRQQLADVGAHWETEDGAGDQSQDGSFPDFPDDVTGSFSSVPVELMGFSIE